MNFTVKCLLGLLMPFLGTSLGAALVFFLRQQLSEKVQKALLGFAAGVMMAASAWSLLIPAIDMAVQQGQIPWVPPLVGFVAGVLFLLVLDGVCARLESRRPGVPGQSFLLMLAITLHNIPEGMAVGVVLAGAMSGGLIPIAAALALSFGIAVQNIPEGAVISLPLAASGMKRSRAFGLGVASGAVEPLGTLLTIALLAFVTPILPYILSFAAGAMIYVVVEELIPEAQTGPPTNAATLGAALGFVLMMTLDVALG